MIQILGLRTFTKDDGKEQKYDKPFEIHTPIKSVKDLFENLDTILKQIPQKHHWNLFYTVANCTDKKREFAATSTIAFDFDDISAKYFDDYIPVICTVLGVDQKKVGIVSSGNGIHILVELKKPITDKAFFKENKTFYKALCTKLNKALENAGLPGKTDPTIFEPRRILRLPGTVNRKPDKPEKPCKLIQPIKAAQDLNLQFLSGLPKLTKTDHIDPRLMKKHPRVDAKAVMSGCKFLEYCKDNPNQISEPQWYAALSITSRLNDSTDQDGFYWSHELSKGYKGYDPDETDEKVTQALESSGPRTCDSITQLWDGCGGCPHFQKVTSPILIRGADTIPTEFTGFHDVPWSGKGQPKPNYDDLVRYFQREITFKCMADSGIVYVWTGTHYTVYGMRYIERFAQENFDPPANEKMRREFRTRVQITNIMDADWWSDSVARKINFQNGYLDIDSMEFRPHDPDIAFRYVLPYDYDPKAEAPTFETMLSAVTGKDQDAQNVLLEYMGYSLSNDDCWAQKALLLSGDGANGKSTFVTALCDLAGAGNYGVTTMDDFKREYNRQLLDGKLFNVSEETPNKALLDNSTFKSLTTGGEIQVRQLYKDPYNIKNRAKLIFTCNDLPGSPDNSYGFYRRLIIVPFNQKFTPESPGYDPHMGDKLRDELAGIFNLAMAGYKRLKDQGEFTKAKVVEDTLESYKLENDTVMAWAVEYMVVYTNGGFQEHFAPLQDLYQAYKVQTEAEGMRPVSQMKFSKSLARLSAELWEGIPYEVRSGRHRIETNDGKVLQVRGLRGIGYRSFS